MNDALCTWCQDIFQGKVNWDPDGDPEWNLKQVQLHHACLKDLKICGEGRMHTLRCPLARISETRSR
jgi:hypothetical protein